MSTTSREIQRKLRRFLDHKIDADDLAKLKGGLKYSALAATDELTKLMDGTKLSSLAVTTLSRKEVQQMFNLTQTVDDELDSVQPVPVPSDLGM